MSKNILIVEDDITLSKVIQKKLQNEGFETEIARSVEEAWAIVHRPGAVSVVWLDHYLLGTASGLDLVVKMKVISSPNLDEPLDIMLYMVVAALGFAAVENILYVLTTMGQMPLEKTLFIVVIRFLGAVFLHTLCSAVIGYSLAMSFCYVKKGSICLLAGIVIATALHGLFNFSIITLHDDWRIIIPIIIILVLALLTFIGFEKLKKMKSICKIN
jgi:CheY-like chemotaxis protein